MNRDELEQLSKAELIELLLENEKSNKIYIGKYVEDSFAAIAVTDPRGSIEFVNQRFQELTGYSFDELYGKNTNVLKSGIQPPEFYRDLWTTISSGSNWLGEFHNKKKNGEIFWDLSSISPIKDSKGNIIHYICVKQEITYLKKFQEKLKSVNEAKNKILSIVAHDLNSSITTLFAFLGILREDLQTKSIEDLELFLEETEKSVGSAAQLIERVISWAKMQRGVILINQEDFLVCDVVQRAFQAFEATASQKQVKLVSDIDCDFRMTADSFMMETVIRNLVSNAVKYSYKESTVTVKVREVQNKCIISVIDNGVGISRNSADKLFNNERVPIVPGTMKERGNGIGLVISRDFVSRHSGEITAAPGEDGGTVFTVSIPLEKDTDKVF